MNVSGGPQPRRVSNVWRDKDARLLRVERRGTDAVLGAFELPKLLPVRVVRAHARATRTEVPPGVAQRPAGSRRAHEIGNRNRRRAVDPLRAVDKAAAARGVGRVDDFKALGELGAQVVGAVIGDGHKS